MHAWKDVRPGDLIRVRAADWKVVAVEKGKVTMSHPGLGTRTGTPSPDAEVTILSRAKPDEFSTPSYDPPDERTREQLERIERAAKAAQPKAADPEYERLRKFAVDEGYSVAVLPNNLNDLRAFLAKKREEKVAKDNDVTPREVEDAHIRLTLGATLIAELRTGQAPQVSEVDKMDVQTMMNHLHFFHDTYPEKGFSLDELARIHEEAKEHERHEHSVPF